MTIALLTDFGQRDIYVGVMKGVILGIDPAAQMVDLNHGVEPQNVRQAALSLMSAYRYFPLGTIFLVVVDPGVGTTRRPVAAEAGGYKFVAPDNGVLSYTLSELGEYQAVEIDIPEEAEISNTFHGRDVFAPVAAKLSLSTSLTDLGSPLKKLQSLPSPVLYVDGKNVVGEVVHIDRFGNLVTSIGHLRWVTPERLMLKPSFGDNSGQITPVFAENTIVTVNDQTIVSIKQTYSEAERGSLLTLVGSNSYLEISVNQGNAASRLDVTIGDRVELQIGDLDAAVFD
ncbi:MAG TPA: SAM-dependent chlorinase/fluorinase [Phototrophicaceae bacterium]|nr:SAM-dependent chlorinase/fluorinase [Phototrophicaceae bacterium]